VYRIRIGNETVWNYRGPDARLLFGFVSESRADFSLRNPLCAFGRIPVDRPNPELTLWWLPFLHFSG
jgi:hypothetical protein